MSSYGIRNKHDINDQLPDQQRRCSIIPAGNLAKGVITLAKKSCVDHTEDKTPHLYFGRNRI